MANTKKDVTTTCKRCSKVFFTSEYNQNRGRGIYCSRNCSQKALVGLSKNEEFGDVKTTIICDECGKQSIKYKSALKKSRSGTHYCSRKCSAKYVSRCNQKRRSRRSKYCPYCSKDITHKPFQQKYCSYECGIQYRYEEKVYKWLSGQLNAGIGRCKDVLSNWARRYMLEQSNYKCSKCGWNEKNRSSGISPLEVSHIDNSPTHHSVENLVVLCPNCHSIEPGYKSQNNGNGRKSRYNKPTNPL